MSYIVFNTQKADIQRNLWPGKQDDIDDTEWVNEVYNNSSEVENIEEYSNGDPVTCVVNKMEGTIPKN